MCRNDKINAHIECASVFGFFNDSRSAARDSTSREREGRSEGKPERSEPSEAREGADAEIKLSCTPTWSCTSTTLATRRDQSLTTLGIATQRSRDWKIIEIEKFPADAKAERIAQKFKNHAP
eukprot:IDg11982t1